MVTADLPLFAVLFTDGVHVSFPKLKENWKNPARALGLGMPLAFIGMALITHYLVGLDWTTSFLVGAVLAPTDPVFASAIVGRKKVPPKLRQLLNVESGINDGLALPVVLVLIAAAGPTSGHAEASFGKIALELGLGLAFGVVLPLLVDGLVRFRLLGAEPKLQPLLPLATGIILYAACHLTHANPYPAAFSAGAVLTAVSPEAKAAFEPLGESLAELAQVRRTAGLRRTADAPALRHGGGATARRGTTGVNGLVAGPADEVLPVHRPGPHASHQGAVTVGQKRSSWADSVAPSMRHSPVSPSTRM